MLMQKVMERSAGFVWEAVPNFTKYKFILNVNGEICRILKVIIGSSLS